MSTNSRIQKVVAALSRHAAESHDDTLAALLEDVKATKRQRDRTFLTYMLMDEGSKRDATLKILDGYEAAASKAWAAYSKAARKRA